MRVYTRSVILLLCGLLLFTLSLAVLNTMVPLWLSRALMPTWQIGIVTSSYFAGNLVGTFIAGKLIQKMGFNRTYYMACLIFGLASLALLCSMGVVSWGIWRFLAGISCALVWVVVESALLRSGDHSNRGQLLAAYMVIYYLGSVLGQLLLGIMSTQLSIMVPWLAAVSILAILPLFATKVKNPAPLILPVSMWSMFKRKEARFGLYGCVASGVVLASLYGLLPLYLNHLHMSDSQVGSWMAVLIGAAILGQYPIGRIADKFGRLIVLRLQLLALVLASMMVLIDFSFVIALLMLGCAAFTMYPVAMAWSCEVVDKDELVAMNQALLMSYTIGCLVGPIITSLMMQKYGDDALFSMVIVVSILYALLLIQDRPRPKLRKYRGLFKHKQRVEAAIEQYQPEENNNELKLL